MGRGPGVRGVGPEAIQVDFRWKGQRCRERIRLKPTPANLRWAERLKATIEHEIAKGTFDYARHFPNSPRSRVHGASPRLASVLTAYCDGLANQVQPETLKEYRQSSDTLVEAFGDPQLQHLTRAQVRTWIAQSSLSKARLDNLLIPLRGALAQAIEDGLLTKNPLDGFKFKRVDTTSKEIDPFTPNEIERLTATELGSLWAFWAWTGLRSGEIIGLQWGDVGDRSESISIRRAVRLGRTKSPKTSAGVRTLLLLPPAQEHLGRAPEGCNPTDPVWINPHTGAYWHEAKALARAFKKACKAASVRYRYVYQLRHSFASRALSSGENPLWVAKYMGHTDVSQIFRHYGKWIPAVDPLAGSRMVESKAHPGQTPP